MDYRSPQQLLLGTQSIEASASNVGSSREESRPPIVLPLRDWNLVDMEGLIVIETPYDPAWAVNQIESLPTQRHARWEVTETMRVQAASAETARDLEDFQEKLDACFHRGTDANCASFFHSLNFTGRKVKFQGPSIPTNGILDLKAILLESKFVLFSFFSF